MAKSFMDFYKSLTMSTKTKLLERKSIPTMEELPTEEELELPSRFIFLVSRAA
jgi:hypothetical protein